MLPAGPTDSVLWRDISIARIAEIAENCETLDQGRALQVSLQSIAQTTASQEHRSHNQPPGLVDTPAEILQSVIIIWAGIDDAVEELENPAPDKSRLEKNRPQYPCHRHQSYQILRWSCQHHAKEGCRATWHIGHQMGRWCFVRQLRGTKPAGAGFRHKASRLRKQTYPMPGLRFFSSQIPAPQARIVRCVPLRRAPPPASTATLPSRNMPDKVPDKCPTAIRQHSDPPFGVR